MSDATLNRLDALSAEGDATFRMDEDAFRVFYDRTARPLKGFLSRLTGDAQRADDLLQETYYRFLRAGADYASDDHQRHALYRIAINVARDAHRRDRRRGGEVPLGPATEAQARGDGTDLLGARADLARAMRRLSSRERELLLLAYSYGWSHVDIARALDLKAGSIKPLLWRARQRLKTLLGGRS
jgi:RNA polymerase sigma-70 factor (ECF subfamily)